MTASTSGEDGYEPAPRARCAAHEDHLRDHLAAAGRPNARRSVRNPTEPTKADWAELNVFNALFSRAWNPRHAYFDSYFFPLGGLQIDRDRFRSSIPTIRIDRPGGSLYPAYAPASAEARELTSAGWVMNPLLQARDLRERDVPGWCWALGTRGTFLDRQVYWEDFPPKKEKVLGAWWLAARVSMLLHLLDRFCRHMRIPGSAWFMVGLRLTKTKRRYLIVEHGFDAYHARPAMADRVDVQVRLQVAYLRSAFREAVAEILGHVAWKMERTDVSAAAIKDWIEKAAGHFGARTLFPPGPEVHAP